MIERLTTDAFDGQRMSPYSTQYLNHARQHRETEANLSHPKSQSSLNSDLLKQQQQQQKHQHLSPLQKTSPPSAELEYRQLSAPGRLLDPGTATHPLQKSVVS